MSKIYKSKSEGEINTTATFDEGFFFVFNLCVLLYVGKNKCDTDIYNFQRFCNLS